MMSGFFRGRAGDKGAKLDKELAALEKQINGASPGYETQFLNRAGNLCVDAGQPGRALGYFGRAIDAYLESGRFGAAEVLCRKILQISPNAVRPRCTLTWLAIGKHAAERSRELADYVEAAENAGQQTLAVKQLVLMAEAKPDPALLEEIGQHLLRLDAPDKADHVFGELFKGREAGVSSAAMDEGKLWAKMLRAVLMGPKEMQGQSWAKGEEEGDNLPSLLRDEPR
jgi:tetratricopeptide (TPR) repeat protein